MHKSHVDSLFAEFLNKSFLQTINSRLQSLSDANNKKSSVFLLVVHFSSLCEFSSTLSQHFLSAPLDTLSTFNQTLHRIIVDNCKSNQYPDKAIVRIVSLPPISAVFRFAIPKSDDVGRFLALHCTVTRVGAVQVVLLERSYCCLKCGHSVMVKADFNQFYAIPLPRRCSNVADKCTSTSFEVSSEDVSSALHSVQEIRVNERLGCLSVGRMPRSVVCCLEDDLVDMVRPGDDIILNGILTHRWRSPKIGSTCNIETVFRANSIENLSEMRFRGELGGENFTQELCKRFKNYWSPAISKDFKTALRLRDEIVKSICPDVYGLYFVKLSLALVLVGAPPLFKLDGSKLEDDRIDNVSKSTNDRADFRVRGNLHLLLMGEPSTAKSALLRSSCRLAGRAIFTAATGTTAAGLTAAAVRDSSGWALEAGALVLADGGICAIDEFTSLRGADRAAVHEAMEQQTVSLAKAGLVARLNCRCAVIAASSLSSEAEHSSDLLPTPLLSRFDLVWRLFDPVGCEAWDSAVADHVLGLRALKEDVNDIAKKKSAGRTTWTTEDLRNYISWVREEFQPQLSKGAATLLQRYYELRRRTLQRLYGMEEDQAVAGRTTLRLLESLVRLTQAHARLMARGVTVAEDAVVAIWLMDCSIQSTFGRSASAIEVKGRCLSPEETVMLHSVENNFEDIIDAVFARLNLLPEDLDFEWYGSISSMDQEIQPICMSTQVDTRDSHKPQPGKSTSSSAMVPDLTFLACKFGALHEPSTTRKSFKNTLNAFDFDADLFMPSGFASLGKLNDGDKLEAPESNFLSKSNSLTVNEHEANSKSVANEEKEGNIEVTPHKKVLKLNIPEPSREFPQTTPSPVSIFKRTGEDILSVKTKRKLMNFTFEESLTRSSNSSLKRGVDPPQMELTRDTEKPSSSSRLDKLPNPKNCLDFQNLAPEDWNLTNICNDFDF